MKANPLFVLILSAITLTPARAQYTNPVTTTPGFLQVGFGPAGDLLLNDGEEFCVPVSTAMNLSYLGLNGFTQIAPSTPTAASELNLVQVLSGLAGTDALVGGTNYNQMANALQVYLAAEGIGTANYTLTITHLPTVSQLTALETPGTVIDLGAGYFDSTGDRNDGHAIALLATGVNALGQSSPNTLTVNNQLPNATTTNGDVNSNILQYLNVIPTTGALTADGSIELDPAQFPGKWTSSKMFVIEEATSLNINPAELAANNPIAATWTITGTQALNLNSGTLPILAPITGAGGITLGQFGNIIAQASNTSTGANTIKSGTWTSTVTSGDPFGTGAITIESGTLALSPTAGSANINLAAASAPGSTFTYINGAEIDLNLNGNQSLTFTIGGNTGGANPNLVRQGTGTLVIAPAFGTSDLGQSETILIAGTTNNLPALTNGIVSPSIIGRSNDGFATGDFLTYGANGLVRATYTDAFHTPIDSAASNSIYVTAINETVAANTTAQVYALNVSGSVNGGAGSILEVGPQTGGQAGIILNGGTINSSILQFGSAEGLIYTSEIGARIFSVIQGSGGLTTFGPGTLSVTAANTYTGPTNVNSGVFQAQNVSGSATGTGNVFVRLGGALEITGPSANVGTPTSTTTVVVGGALLLNGGTISGNLQMNSGSYLFGHGTIAAAATISGVIGNSGTPSQVISYSGVEDITFQNAVTFGATTLYSWKLNALDAAPADAGVDWSLLNFNSATATAGTTANPFIIDLDLGRTVPDPNSGNAFWSSAHQWLIADDPQGFGSISWNQSFSGFTQGTFNVVLDSASKDLYIDYAPKGVYWLGGTGGSWLGNSWASDSTGTPTIGLPKITDDVVFSATGAANQGATTLGENWAIHSLTVSDPKPVVINSGVGGPFTLTIAGALGTGITVFTGSNLTINSGLTLGGESDTIEVDGTGVATINGLLSGSNGLTKTGTGKLTLADAANNYTGGTTINGGLISISNSGALGAGDVTMNDGSALLTTASVFLPNFLTVRPSATATISAATGTTLTVSQFQLDGNVVFGSAGNTGVIVIGPLGNLFGEFNSSTIDVAFGTLRNGVGLSVYTRANTSTTVNAGATLDLHDNAMEIAHLQGAGAITLGTNSATVLTLDAGAFSGVISGVGQLAKSTGNTLVLTGTNTYTGSTTINAGTLQLGTGGTTGSIVGNVADNGNLTFDHSNAVTFPGAITGTGTVTQAGAGVLTLTGANTYSGGTNINAGEVSIKTAGALGTGSVTLSGGELLTTATMTLTSQVGLTSGSTATVAAGTGTTLTLDNVAVGTNGAANIVFGSMGNTGLVVIGPANGVGTFPGSTLDVAFGTLRNGGGPSSLGFLTESIAVTTVNAGATLDVHDNGMEVKNLQGAGTITLGTSSATILTLDAGNFSGVISGAGHVTTTAPVTLTGTNTYTGGTTISSGTLQLGTGGMTGSITGSVTDKGQLIFDHSNAVTFAGAISGTGGITQNGAGLLTLTGANIYSGGTNINAGEVSIKTAGALGTGSVTLSGGELLTTATMTLTSQVGLTSGSTATVAAGTGTTLTLDNVAVGTNGAANIVFGSMGNTGLVVIGPANGVGTFPGSTLDVAFGTLRNGGGPSSLGFLTESIAVTTVNAGATLDVHDNGMEVKNLQGAGTITLGTSSATILTLDAGNFSGVISGAGHVTTTAPVTLTGTNTYTGGTTVTGGTLQLGTGGLTGSILGNIALNADLAFDRSNTLTFAGVISGSGTVTQSGAGALTLTGANTYTGGTNINAGSLSIKSPGAIGTGNVTLSGGALLVGATATFSNDFIFAAGVTSTLAAAPGSTVTLENLEIDGNAVFGRTGQTGVIVIGPLTTSNATANATIDIVAGTVRNGIGGTTGLGGLTNFLASTTLAAGATLDLDANRMEINNLQGAGAITLGTNVATILFLDAGNFSGVISGSGRLTKNTTGTLILTGTNTYSGGGTVINAGTLQIGNGGTAGSIPSTGPITDDGNLTFAHSNALSYSGVISGTGALTQSGTGALTLTGVNTYSGGTTLNAGLVSINNSSALGTGQVTMNGGALLATTTMTLANIISDNSNTNDTISAGTGTTLTLQQLQLPVGAETIFGSTGNTGVIVVGPITGGVVSNGAAIDIAFGTVRNGGANLSGLGFYTAGVASATIATGATLDVHDLAMEIKNLQGAGAVTLGISAATVLTLDAGSYSGVISGAGQLVKTTTGPLTLAGANTYTGGTTLSTGILLANNTAGSATGTGPVTIDSGATLGGKGKITGPATLESGGFIAPGVGASGVAGTTLHTASLIWNGGGALTLQLGATGDELALSGALTKGAAGTFTLDILNAGITKTTYTLATFTSTTFTLSDFTLDLPVNYTGTLVETSTSLILEDLLDPPPPAGVELPTSGLADNGNNGPTDSGISTVIPTPEPASTALLFLGVAALFGRRRRLRPPGAEIGPNLGPLISPTAAKKKPI